MTLIQARFEAMVNKGRDPMLMEMDLAGRVKERHPQKKRLKSVLWAKKLESSNVDVISDGSGKGYVVNRIS